jgi:hypothetical protein
MGKHPDAVFGDETALSSADIANFIRNIKPSDIDRRDYDDVLTMIEYLRENTITLQDALITREQALAMREKAVKEREKHLTTKERAVATIINAKPRKRWLWS